MKKAIIAAIFVLLCIAANAQTLTGVVYDKETKQPIPFAYVYFDGTSIGNFTDDAGKYTLTVSQIINTRLVVRNIGYNTVIIENPFVHLPDTIYMEEQMRILEEITVSADPFTRQQKLKVFREQFLGQTQAGRSCKIVNEDDIDVWFNVATKTLLASSEQPIEVINEYLGYKIFFELVDFQVDYSNVSLNQENVRQSFFAVITAFVDLRPDDRRIKRRRDEVYYMSSTFFFKNLAENTLSKAGFRIIFRNETITDFSKCFIIEDTPSLKTIQIIPNIMTGGDMPLRSDVPISTMNVIYSRRQTNVTFNTDVLLVDNYGNIDKIDKVLFSGTMEQNRAGGMLPMEYEP